MSRLRFALYILFILVFAAPLGGISQPRVELELILQKAVDMDTFEYFIPEYFLHGSRRLCVLRFRDGNGPMSESHFLSLTKNKGWDSTFVRYFFGLKKDISVTKYGSAILLRDYLDLAFLGAPVFLVFRDYRVMNNRATISFYSQPITNALIDKKIFVSLELQKNNDHWFIHSKEIKVCPWSKMGSASCP